MTELEQKAHDYFVKDCVEYDEEEFIYNNFEKAVTDSYKKGYEQGQEDCRIQELKGGNPFFIANELQKENAELKQKFESDELALNEANEIIAELKAQIEKMKCCGNCGNARCTSKYRGNSAYHRQEDGYACADNEDWIERI